MPAVIGKTVYILGAGASYHCGAPLLNNFLTRAKSLMFSRKTLIYKDSFERLFVWIDELRAQAYYLNIDLDNLEHVFSIIATMRSLGYEGAEQLYKDMSFVIFETLDNEIMITFERSLRPDPIYASFGNILDKTNDARKLKVNKFSKDSLVTLNYDVMLEYSMRGRVNYCLVGDRNPDDWKLLKLHGSCNWGVHFNCDKHDVEQEPRIQVALPSPIPPGHTLAPGLENGAQFPFRMVTNTLKNTECVSCKRKDTLTPLFIPPTWCKEPGPSGIKNVWKEAIKEFQEAFQIIIIGYSMPITDTFLPYLLSLGLTKNQTLHRVIIVNPDRNDDFKKRYCDIFSKSLIERNRLIFEHSTFKDFVNRGMPICFEH